MSDIGIVGKNCFGCTACKAVCPQNAIKMEENKEGFLVPVIKKDICVHCEICSKVCPALNKWNCNENNEHINVFAYKNDNLELLKESTSGGFFSKIVQEIDPEWVCGCVQDKSLEIEHILSNDLQDIKRMRGSKYVQSNLKNVFNEIKDELVKGNRIVFSGTSCQVHGLLNYLKIANVSTENLVTIDLVCHGVPSPKIYSDFLNFYAKTKKDVVIAHKSRSKKYGWGGKLGTLNYVQTIFLRNHLDDKSLEANLWQNIFFSDFGIRESCYLCPYTSVNKPADITIGDFWGVEDFFPEHNFSNGCSLVITKTDDYKKFMRKITNLQVDREDIKHVVEKQGRLRNPVKRPQNREKFWTDYSNNNFEYIAKKYFNYKCKSKIFIKIYNILLFMKMYKWANKISKLIFY